MTAFEEFKQLLTICWCNTENDWGGSMQYGECQIYIEPHWSGDGERLLWVVFEDENGIDLRGDSIYAEGFDDEHLQEVFKYITTGEDY